MNTKTLAPLAALLGYGIFGFSFLFSKLALNQASPLILLAVRFIVAFALMNLILFVGKIPFSLKGKPVKPLLLLGIIEPVIYFLCENYGISLTTTSFSGIMLGTIPVFGLLFGSLLLKERFTPFQWMCAVGSICGVALTCVGGEVAFSTLGVILLVCAAMTAALFNVISTGISAKFSAVERTYVMLALGCLVFPAVALVENRSDLTALLTPLSSPGFWVAVAYLAGLSSVGAFFLLNFAMSHVSVAISSIFANFSTVISVLAGIFIMGDDFTLPQIAGIVLITLCVAGVSLPQKGKKV